ncbi:hypothetical protein GJ496_004630 [Pomphorhynchus laevis]|nr:hypothetical protein GJ496_004630 [Pomphorhynchus laevis]
MISLEIVIKVDLNFLAGLLLQIDNCFFASYKKNIFVKKAISDIQAVRNLTTTMSKAKQSLLEIDDTLKRNLSGLGMTYGDVGLTNEIIQSLISSMDRSLKSLSWCILYK